MVMTGIETETVGEIAILPPGAPPLDSVAIVSLPDALSSSASASLTSTSCAIPASVVSFTRLTETDAPTPNFPLPLGVSSLCSLPVASFGSRSSGCMFGVFLGAGERDVTGAPDDREVFLAFFEGLRFALFFDQGFDFFFGVDARVV